MSEYCCHSLHFQCLYFGIFYHRNQTFESIKLNEFQMINLHLKAIALLNSNNGFLCSPTQHQIFKKKISLNQFESGIVVVIIIAGVVMVRFLFSFKPGQKLAEQRKGINE